MNELAVAKVLRDKGFELFQQPRKMCPFTGNLTADKLLNDLVGTPHAYVIACIMDRGIKAERAWLIPYLIAVKLGDFRFSTLTALSHDQCVALMTIPAPLHRFPATMAESMYLAVKLIAARYVGNAGLIWANNPGSATVVNRFLEFKGVGPKIATMAANILVRDLSPVF